MLKTQIQLQHTNYLHAMVLKTRAYTIPFVLLKGASNPFIPFKGLAHYINKKYFVCRQASQYTWREYGIGLKVLYQYGVIVINV